MESPENRLPNLAAYRLLIKSPAKISFYKVILSSMQGRTAFKNVIAIDDDQDDIEIIHEALSIIQPGISFTSFLQSDEAISSLTSSDFGIIPDFILIDINMPKIDGVACLKILSNQPHLKDVQIGICSTAVSTFHSQELMSIGAAFTIQKPPTLSEYVEVFQNILYSSSSHHAYGLDSRKTGAFR